MGNKRGITNLVLLAMEKSIDGLVRFTDFTYNTGFYAYGSWQDRNLKKSDISRVLKRLREKGLIELVSDETLAYRLTDQGRDKAVLQRLKTSDMEKWDGRWRLVVFDIPEKRRTARDLLRSKLKQWGFALWQQSVWVTKKNCTQELRNFVKNIGIQDWVMVIESDNIGR